MENTFTSLSEADFKKGIDNILDEVTDLKRGFMYTLISNKVGNNSNSFKERFLNFLNNYLKRFEDDSLNAQNELQSINSFTCSNTRVFEHNFFNDVVYGNYDYASILQYVDGLEDGIEDNVLKNPSDVDRFSAHTITMAFNKMGTNVGSLVDMVTEPQVEGLMDNCSEIDCNTIKSMKTSRDLFSVNNRIEIYKSISEVIRYLGQLKENDLPTENIKLRIAFIDSICNYISYTIALYVTRYYIIQKQISYFVPNVVNESTVIDPEKEPVGDCMCPTTWNAQSIEELVVKDYRKWDILVDQLKQFCDTHRIPFTILQNPTANVENTLKREYRTGNYEVPKQDPFYKKLLDLPLGNLILTKEPSYVDEFNNGEKYYRMLRDYLHRNRNASDTDTQMTSEKDILLDTIASANTSAVTHESYIRSMVYLLDKIRGLIRESLYDASIGLADRSRAVPTNLAALEDPGARKHNAVIAEWFETLYEEVAFAFIQNMRKREVEIQKADTTAKNNLDKMLSLKVKDLIDDWDDNHQTMLSAPHALDPYKDTNQLDFFSRPIHEAFEMYNEYIASLPEFANDLYFKEVDENTPEKKEPVVRNVVNKVTDSISTIITKLKAIIQALWDRVKNFWAGKSFQLARKWVIDNEQTLNTLEFDNTVARMEVLPYKENITLPRGFNNLIEGIKKFNKDQVRSRERLQQYLKTLYPSADIANWFANDKDADQRYMNLILFDNGSNTEKQRVVLTGDAIKRSLLQWIATIKNSEAVQKDFKRINEDIMNGVNSINSMLVSMTRPTNAENEQTPDVEMISFAMTRISASITRLWSPVAPAVIKAMMNQYGYIKDAYGMRNNEATQSNAANNMEVATGEL